MYVYSSFSAPLIQDSRKGAAQKAAYMEVPNQVMSFMNRKKHPLGFYVKGYVDQVSYTMQKVEQQPDGSWIFPIPTSLILKIQKNSGDIVDIAMNKDRLSFPMTDAFMVVFYKEPQEVRNYYYSTQMSPEEKNLYNEWVYRARTEAERTERIARAIEGLRNKLSFEAMKRATGK